MHVDVIIFSHTSCWFCYTIILFWDSCEVSRAGENSFFSMQGHLCGVVQKQEQNHIWGELHILLYPPSCSCVFFCWCCLHVLSNPLSLCLDQMAHQFSLEKWHVGFKPTFCLWTILVICFIFMFLVSICLKFWNYSLVICQA